MKKLLLLFIVLLAGCINSQEILPIPTQTPLPTLSSVQIEQEILKLYSDNGGCELPCFWGIVPGKTTFQEVDTRFSLLGEVSEEDYRWKNEHKLIPIKIDIPSEIDSFNEKEWSFYIIASNGVVESIIANSRLMKQTSIPTMSNMLSIFGKPEEIWIAVMPYIPKYDADADYEIALFYPSKGILIMGSGIADILAETENRVKVSICPQKISETIDMDRHYPFSLHLWSSKNKMSFINASYDDKLFEHGFFSNFDSLESSINSDKFYETYLDPSATQCFELTQ